MPLWVSRFPSELSAVVSRSITSLHIVDFLLTDKRGSHTGLLHQLHTLHTHTTTDLILPPSLIEDHIHDDAGKATVVLNHAYQLPFKLLLLCMQPQQK